MHSIIGMTVRDQITGFAGTVTGRVEYITGCNQLLVAPKAKDDGTLPEPAWFDEQRCEAFGDVKRVVLDNGSNPGCDRPAPQRGGEDDEGWGS